MLSLKTAAILTVKWQCGKTSLTWTLGKYGLFSHSRSLACSQCPATVYQFPFTTQASAHSCSARWVYSYFFRFNEQEWRAESCTNCLESKLSSGLPTDVHHTFQLSFFIWRNIVDFPNSEIEFRLLFYVQYCIFLFCQFTFKAKLTSIQ